MPEQLHFRLYAALASWGDIAVGEMRPSANRPTRSAVLGLVAAALGIRRDEEERLAALDNLGVAMRVDDPGLPLHDYHTTQAAPNAANVQYRTRRDEFSWNMKQQAKAKYSWDEKKERFKWNDQTMIETILSSRAYRQDSLVHVALLRAPDVGESCPTLESCRQALETPYFPLYLGRRSCPPALPLAPRIVAAATCAEALRVNPPPPIELPGKALLPVSGDNEAWFWDDIWQQAGAAPAEPQRTERRHDRKTNHRAWLFAQRDEYAASIACTEASP